jgi:glycosyltransferase involved in cell wall biosynthesis
MRILMVTPYPPARDGIASYAVQEVKVLRAAGHDVEVLSPGPSAAHHHLALRGPRGPLALAKRVRGYDRVVVQFHPDVFYPHPLSGRDRLEVTAGLHLAFLLSRRVEIRVHEVNYDWGRDGSRHARLFRALWQRVDEVTVHTEDERSAFSAAFDVAPSSVRVIEHGGHFERRAHVDRAEARRHLGLPDDQLVFLSIGFVQPHKGFDRAVRAFAGLDAHGCRLDVVGSIRVDEPEYVVYRDELAELVARTPGAHLHDEYVSDWLFDVWLVAADVVVLPYRYIWSSGVLERAKQYDRPVIATRVGGMEGQASDVTQLVDDDRALRRALWAAAGAVEAASERPVQHWPVDHAAVGEVDRSEVQGEIRRRAAADRTHATVHTLEVQGVGDREAADASAPLRNVPLFAVPPPVSARRSSRFAKRVVHRLAYWLVAPVIEQLNDLRAAAIASVERAEHARSDPDRHASPGKAGARH